MNQMKEITSAEIVFENCQSFKVNSKNIGYIMCDDYITTQKRLPNIFFYEDKHPNHFKLKLKNPIDENLLSRLEKYSDINYVKLFTSNNSVNIIIPYNDLNKNNLFSYIFEKIKRFFKKDVLLGENLNQRMKYYPDWLEIVINKEYYN